MHRQLTTKQKCNECKYLRVRQTYSPSSENSRPGTEASSSSFVISFSSPFVTKSSLTLLREDSENAAEIEKSYIGGDNVVLRS